MNKKCQPDISNMEEKQMKTARQLIAQKGNETLSVDSDSSVFEALGVMAKHDVGALLVLHNNQLAGIFSERDYARSIVLKGRASKDTRVAEVMSNKVISVGPNETIEACMNIMTDHRIRHLPVVDNGQLIGVLSIGDLVKETINYQRFLIEQLEKYIQS
jgi:CBS domain-containing protein